MFFCMLLPCFPIAHVNDSSPGPRYYVEPCLTRFGRSAGPAYSIQARGKSAGRSKQH